MTRRIEAPHCESAMGEGVLRLMANLMEFSPEQRLELQDTITNLAEEVIRQKKASKTQTDEKANS